MIPVAAPPPSAITIAAPLPPSQQPVALAMRGQEQDAPPPAPGAAPDPTVTPSAQPQVATAPAARPASRNPQDVHLLGDWFGARTRLVKAGITPTLTYIQQGLANVRGGTNETFITAGQFTAGLQFDLDRISGGDVPAPSSSPSSAASAIPRSTRRAASTRWSTRSPSRAAARHGGSASSGTAPGSASSTCGWGA